MEKEITLYGRGDVKSVSFTRCMELDFKEMYGLDLKNYLYDSFSNKRKFDTQLEYLRYDRDVIRPEKVSKIKSNPDMYPPLKLNF